MAELEILRGQTILGANLTADHAFKTEEIASHMLFAGLDECSLANNLPVLK